MPIYPKPSLLRDIGGYRSAPHPDTRAKVVTLHFYLAPDMTQMDLGTALYRRRLMNPRILLSVGNLFENVKQFDFKPNSRYAFPVGRSSWHGREALRDTAGIRQSLILFYYRDPNREW